VKLLRVLKAVDMLKAAAFVRGGRQKEALVQCFVFMRRSGLGCHDISLVSARLGYLESYASNRKSVRAGNSRRNRCATNGADRTKRTSGLRVFGKAYGVRGFRFALGACHWGGIKFHKWLV